MAPKATGAMHVSKVVSRQRGKEYTAVLVRQSYREDGKVKHRTLANLTHLPGEVTDVVQAMLRGEPMTQASSALRIERSLPHGHVHSVLGMARKLGLEQVISSTPSRNRNVIMGVIVQRLLNASSKLGMTRNWGDTTLASMLDIEEVSEDDVYEAMDWLLKRQKRIEAKLAVKHLAEGGLALYDLSSSYVEGTHCDLAKRGYSRDGKPGTLQIEYGVMTNTEGCPVAVEVFEGNTADPVTVPTQVEKLQERFGLIDIALVGDRGMLTTTQIDKLREKGLGWISSLRAPAIRRLAESGALQMSLFDERNLAEIHDPSFPDERLVVCRNPALAEERKRKREDLLRATERNLQPIVERAAKGRLCGAAEIGMQVGKVINQYKVAKHFDVVITESSVTVQRRQKNIDAEAAMDGIYVIRTSVRQEKLGSADVVRAYKNLAQVERAFRSFKGIDIQVRPIYHRADDRVRAHVLICMLTYYVQWHLERAWAPLLFRDEAKPVSEDPVAPAYRSTAAVRKARTRRTADGFPVHSFGTLLDHMATMTRNQIVAPGTNSAFHMTATPTPLQNRALSLLGISGTL